MALVSDNYHEGGQAFDIHQGSEPGEHLQIGISMFTFFKPV
jgi:hypothetical protein